jgi:hypothetical protein
MLQSKLLSRKSAIGKVRRLARHSKQSIFARHLKRQPRLLALLLTLRNRASRLAERPRPLIGLLLVSAAVSVGLVTFVRLLGARQLNLWLTYLQSHASLLLLLAGLQAAITVARRRRQVAAALRDSWLSSTPRSAETKRSSLILGVLWVPLAQLGIGMALVLLLHYAGQGDAKVLRQLIVALVSGCIAGILVGAVFTTKPRGADRPGSRYVPRKITAHASAVASLAALSRWPIASAFAWATPDTVRWPLMAAMLSVMSGSPALVGLGVVGFWMLIVYIAALFASTLRVAREAALWLRSTPLSFSRFAFAIGARSFVHQAAATVVIGVCFALETGTVWKSLLFVSPWIAFVMVAYVTTIGYAFSMRRGTRVTILVSAISIACVETLQRGTAVPLALGVCWWQIRLGTRGRYPPGELHAIG